VPKSVAGRKTAFAFQFARKYFPESKTKATKINANIAKPS
jgi:hypothetical protein